jgi:diguanylate cyclase (GGDEF)-like protein
MTAISRWMRSWEHNTSDWVESSNGYASSPERNERIFDDLADVVRSARTPAEIDGALVRLACQLAAARHAELILEPIVGAASPTRGKLIACWPDTAALDASEPESAIRQSSLVRGAASGGGDPQHVGGPTTPLNLTVANIDESRTTLRLIPPIGQRWTPRLIRQLTTLCTLVAAARAARASIAGTAALNLPPDAKPQLPMPDSAVRDEGFLSSFIPYVLAQAQRTRDTLALICVSVDRFEAIQNLLGAELTEAAMHSLATRIAQTLRASDVVARVPGGRVIVVLPPAKGADPLPVVESLRRSIACMGSAATTAPGLRASIGVATYPGEASSAHALVEAATAAARRAQTEDTAADTPSLPARDDEPRG